MRILFGINYSESWPVSNRWIRVSRLRLDTNDSLSFLQFSTEHLMPLRKILCWTLGPVWTSSARLDYRLELVRFTSADKRDSLSKRFLRVLIIDWNSFSH